MKAQAEIRLDYRPMREPDAVFVTVQAGGDAAYIRYSPALLRVLEIRRGPLPPKAVESFFARTKAPALREAFARRSFTGNGLLQGDQIYLSAPQDTAQGEVVGFVEETPREVQALVRDLLELEKSLRPTAPAPAYVRSEPIAPDRLKSIRKAGKVKLVPIGEVPAPLLGKLDASLDRSHQFIPITRADYELLLNLAAGAHELFLTQETRGYQLTMFTAPAKHEGKDP